MKVGFIGCGNMGGALATAIAKNTDVSVLLADRDETKAAALAEAISAEVVTAEAVAAEADFIFMGLKPYLIASVLTELRGALEKNPDAVVVSMAAGVELAKINGVLPQGQAAIRIMPNTSVALGEGMVVYTSNGAVTEGAKAEFCRIMAPTGKLDELAEGLIDAATAVMGCGPAFAYVFLEAMADGAVSCGLPRDKATLYAAQMLRGAAEMALASGKHPEVLKDEVCSPGGSTIEGVGALEQGAFRATTRAAVRAAYEKNRQLG
ncbi:MAG: pyrroline-5-carboxylate reductase [Clostridia bacterium]|nr:pyrroline-5-carboxylate reductase [Clostridia bacterium]